MMQRLYNLIPVVAGYLGMQAGDNKFGVQMDKMEIVCLDICGNTFPERESSQGIAGTRYPAPPLGHSKTIRQC